MSVYFKEKPEYLKAAIESMLNQTLKSNDFVIVCDGQLTEELYTVLDYFEKNPDNCIRRLQLETNSGLGIALNKGIEFYNNEIIARMDSDDIAESDRCEIEMNKVNGGFDLVGSWVDEFETKVTECVHIREVPEQGEELVKFAKNRNPFNHPTVMFKKEIVKKSWGGIQRFN